MAIKALEDAVARYRWYRPQVIDSDGPVGRVRWTRLQHGNVVFGRKVVTRDIHSRVLEYTVILRSYRTEKLILYKYHTEERTGGATHCQQRTITLQKKYQHKFDTLDRCLHAH